MKASSNALGLLQLGSLASEFYIDELKNKSQIRSNSSIPLKIQATDFDQINNLLPTPSEELEVIMKNYIDDLSNRDVSVIIIPNITLHETVDKLSIEPLIIHPVHLTIRELKKHNQSQVVLFGSNYTMKSDYIALYFENQGISVSVPSSEDMNHIDTLRKNFYQGIHTSEMQDNFQFLIDKYKRQYPVVLACTELSFHNSKENTRVYDMSRLQIAEALKIFR